MVRQQQIVIIQEAEQFTLSQLQSSVTCKTAAALGQGFVGHRHTGRQLQFIYDRARIGCTVLDYH
ncbi:hypothetical protein D3C85_1868750 [compost metagenome]